MFIIRGYTTSRRFLSTTNIFLKNINSLNIIDNRRGLQLEKDDGQNIRIPLIWLRDHCKSKESYNWSTFQKNVSLNDLWKQSEVTNDSDIKLNKENQKLYIKWSDGHKSEYDINSILKSHKYKNNQIPEKILWNKKTFLSNSKPLSYKNLNLKEFYKEFFKYGLVFVNDVPYDDPKHTEELCKKIACIQNTLFGDFWVFSNNTTTESHADTAYTSLPIGLHTDCTYFKHSPGIQVLHCLHKAKSGGENILTDGMYCAQKLNKKYPTYFQFLSSNKFYHHYKELPRDRGNGTGYHSINNCKIIETSNGEVKQISFNPYDRMDLTIGEGEDDYDKLMMFYQSYIKFNEILSDDENKLVLTLNPGTVMFMDNRRVLHARKEFEGKRVMCGAYLNYDDLEARANSLFEGDKIEYL
uniref:Trimethyllysine dioxygenase, mitochondrial n=1 Tax=Strongyloides papillosus TaxID=174720 RepID=A0A0N5BRA2_STREA